MDDVWLAKELVQRGLVDQAKIRAAREADSSDLPFALLTIGAISEHDLLRFLGLQFQARYVTAEKLSQAKIQQWVLDLLPIEACERLSAVPVKADEASGALSVVTSRPEQSELVHELRQVSGAPRVDIHIALEHAVAAAIRKWYKGDIHAFARAEQLLDRGYPQILDIYDQRAIDLGPEPRSLDSLELVTEPPGSHSRGSLNPPAPSAAVSVAVTVTPARSITAPRMPAPRHERSAQSATSGTSPGAAPPLGPTKKLGSTAAARAELASPAAGAAPALGAVQSPLGWDRVLAACRPMVHLLEGNQGWKQGHATEMDRLACALAPTLGMGQEQTEMLRLACLIHDAALSPEPHLTVLTVAENSKWLPRARACASIVVRLFQSAQFPERVFDIIGGVFQHFETSSESSSARPSAPPPLASAALGVLDAYCDLMRNPKAPGGRAADTLAATARLFRAADAGALPREIVSALSELLHGPQSAALGLKGRPHVMVIEPDLQQGRLVDHALERAGIDVRLAQSTAQAARELLAAPFDAIISEVDVQPVDGFDFAERIRDDARTRRTPLLFMTTRSAPEDRNRAQRLGAAAFLSKPVAPDTLRDELLRHIDKSTNHGDLIGGLDSTPLRQILSALTAGRKSGVLRIGCGSISEVHWEEGRVVGALHQGATGDEAMGSLLALGTGAFAFDSTSAAELHNVTLSTDALLKLAGRS